ncbi:MAG: 3-oxoacyl-ACP reductase FabG [Acidimicrobiia bacterium]|nr:MAG: 3-oxoacyl-ACP reductase FabG [Acidimicrobiia bacterium]
MYTLAAMAALDGHRAVVTGASRNLGAEIAARLAAAGAAVAVNYRSSQDEAEAVVASLPDAGGGHHRAVAGDVADPDGADRVVTEAAKALGGPIDILVNNAGPYSATPFVELEEEEFDRVWNANARATYLMSRAAAPGMRDGGWGRIVNLSASSAFVRNRSVYTLANAAIITLTEELAVELAPQIGVNAIAPGQIQESLEELTDIVPDWAVQVVAATPRGRLVTRREIADIVVLLCGPLFDSVTGVTLPVDGGLRLNTF